MRRRRKSLGAHLLTGLAHAILLLGAIIMVLPMIWMLLTSFKPAPEIAMNASQGSIWLLVQRWKARVFQAASFDEMRGEASGVRLSR